LSCASPGQTFCGLAAASGICSFARWQQDGQRSAGYWIPAAQVLDGLPVFPLDGVFEQMGQPPAGGDAGDVGWCAAGAAYQHTLAAVANKGAANNTAAARRPRAALAHGRAGAGDDRLTPVGPRPYPDHAKEKECAL
jgi:hypothetical protein